MPFPTAKISDTVIFFDGTYDRPALVTSDDLGDGRVGLNVDPGSLNGEVVVRTAPYDATGLRADSWRWQPGSTPVFPPEGTYYDIRQYGAVPGLAGKAATTAAFNAIFAAINWGYFPDVTGKTFAYIYVPSVETGDAWYIGDLDPYVGSTGASIFMSGDGTNNSGVRGSTIFYDGTLGGTMFELIAINLSNIQNICFNGGGKAKYLVNPHQYWNAAHSFQVASNWLYFVNCVFTNPIGDYESALVLAGKDDDPPNTLQAADYRFSRCEFVGHSTIPGYGFRDLIGGNTKQWAFYDCVFLNLYQGIHARSGFLVVQAIEGGNIGYDGDIQAALIYTGAAGTTVTGVALENGTPGFAAQTLFAAQGSPATMSGGYSDGSYPPPGYAVSFGGPGDLCAIEFSGGLTVARGIAWAPDSPVRLGRFRTNDGGKWYYCRSAGTTGNSGGPTGTADSGIMDGTVEWGYTGQTGDANNAKIQVGGSSPGGNSTGNIIACQFPYNTTPIFNLPVYDGSNNILGAALGTAGTDYAKSVDQHVYARGNLTGLRISNYNQLLPDFDGTNVINQRDQLWNDNATAGLTYLRNDTGVAIIAVPAAAIAAQGAGVVALGSMPPGYKFTECIVDVTTLFSGPAVTGIKAAIGNNDVGAPYDDILLAGAIDATGQFGLLGADRGAGWDSNRYIVTPFDGGSQPYIVLKCSVTGGLVTDINAGSLNVYLQFQRLKT